MTVFEKFIEIQENLAEMQRRRWRNNHLKPEFWSVLPNYRLNSPRNHHFFLKIGLVIPG
jgi:hypothetical protein